MRLKKTDRQTITLIAACMLLSPLPVQSAITTVTGPVPVSPSSQIFGAADVDGAALSIDLDSRSYVEEEYFIGGTADAFLHKEDGPKLSEKDIAFTTRLIIRRPKNVARFSGVVHFEPIHPSQGGTSHWLVNADYMMAQGDIYVAAGLGDDAPSRRISREGRVPTAQSQIIKWFDPVRYAATSWPEEDGIRYDLMAQLGIFLRGRAPDNPLRRYHVRRMIVGGWSFTGSLQRSFINEGFHDRARLPGGKPVFDGYLIGISSRWNGGGYVPLNSKEDRVELDDPRRELRKIDVPVIEFMSEFEVATGKGVQRPDSDLPIGRHRLYALGGTIHSASLVGPGLPRTARPNIRQLETKGYPLDEVRGEDGSDNCGLPISDVPHAAVARAVLDNLKRWTDGGAPPPHAAPLETQPDGAIVRDAVGNPVGGIRIAEFEQPLASYGAYTGTDQPMCSLAGRRPHFVRQDFAHDKLVRRYKDAATYLRRYNSSIDALVRDRWLLAPDAKRLKAETRVRAEQLFKPGVMP